ncbi:UNVERIFIED_CONTAM: protein ROOT HAIR SPECIFIC 17 [Sesamum angustifolium]|uniref:O-fucosyltransferase family protein n=1 Tax=Sesamum angustifolium TaxID=2727405 RepID=A0AAW2QD65_9LAMI
MSQIVDAVVAAYILNATLVVPKLDQKTFWKDSSNFSEIFDIDWFITVPVKDVKIIKEFPQRQAKSQRQELQGNAMKNATRLASCPSMRESAYSVQLTKFDYRLSNRLN